MRALFASECLGRPFGSNDGTRCFSFMTYSIIRFHFHANYYQLAPACGYKSVGGSWQVGWVRLCVRQPRHCCSQKPMFRRGKIQDVPGCSLYHASEASDFSVGAGVEAFYLPLEFDIKRPVRLVVWQRQRCACVGVCARVCTSEHKKTRSIGGLATAALCVCVCVWV